MPLHKFKVGQLVRFQHSPIRNATDIFEVIRLLPAGEDGEFQYHVKSAQETHARIAKEHQLSKASRR